MSLSLSTIGKNFIGAIPNGCDVYVFSQVILFPLLTAIGIPLPPALLSQTTSLIAGSIASIGLFVTGLVEKSKKTTIKEQAQEKDQYTVTRIHELFAELTPKLSPNHEHELPDDHYPTRSGRILKSGLTQAATIWAVSSAIIVPLLGISPFGATALLMSSILAVGVGSYYALLKSQEIEKEQHLAAENQLALSQYNSAVKLYDLSQVDKSHKSTLKEAVNRVIHQSRGFTEVVRILREYNITKAWEHKKAVGSAFFFGALTGSSVATILATLACSALAIMPPGWVAWGIAGAGALWLGYNNSTVAEDKFNRKRNLALTRIFREKTQLLLEETEERVNANSHSPSKMAKGLDVNTPQHHDEPDARLGDSFSPLFTKKSDIVPALPSDFVPSTQSEFTCN